MSAGVAGEREKGIDNRAFGSTLPIRWQATLTVGDRQRLDGGVADAVLDTAARAGYISPEAARAVAAEGAWHGNEPSVPVALLVTFSDSARADEGLTSNRPVWLVRYAVDDVTTPDGRSIPYGYAVIDARTGQHIYTEFAL